LSTRATRCYQVLWRAPCSRETSFFLLMRVWPIAPAILLSLFDSVIDVQILSCISIFLGLRHPVIAGYFCGVEKSLSFFPVCCIQRLMCSLAKRPWSRQRHGSIFGHVPDCYRTLFLLSSTSLTLSFSMTGRPDSSLQRLINIDNRLQSRLFQFLLRVQHYASESSNLI
jgi:hypothetical protein